MCPGQKEQLSVAARVRWGCNIDLFAWWLASWIGNWRHRTEDGGWHFILPPAEEEADFDKGKIARDVTLRSGLARKKKDQREYSGGDRSRSWFLRKPDTV